MPGNDQETTPHRSRRRMDWLLPTLVLTGGVVGAIYLLNTAPSTAAEAETTKVKTVRTKIVKPQTHAIKVSSLGTVIPSKQVTISSEVRGRVVRLHPQAVPGGHLRTGEEILGIDESDYQIALAEQKSTLAEALSELQLEQGRQVVASREWEQLKKELPNIDVNRDLVLRVPHRQKIEATLDRARSLIERAELDLRRTSITAPFNALILDESVEIGQLVNPGDEIATLAGSDTFWVQASVRQDEIPHIQFPTETYPGAPARVTLETGDTEVVYEGQVVQYLSDLEPNGLNARVIVSIPDPLNLSTKRLDTPVVPLLLRSVVRVEIDAGELHDALALESNMLHNGNHQVWVVDANATLQIRETQPLWSQGDIVYVQHCLEPADAVVLGLRSLVPGSKVRPQTEETTDSESNS